MKSRIDVSFARRRALAVLGLTALGAGLAGCTQIVPGQTPPPELYRLTPKSTFPPDLQSVDWQLLVETPTASAGLNSPRVALMRDLTRLEYYARTNWTDRAPNMVQSLIIESFENSDAIVAVGRQSVALRADYLLKTELREFQAEYFDGTPPHAHVAVNAKLVEMPERRIIASNEFRSKFKAKADRMQEIVQAFDEALGDVLKDLVVWALDAGRENA
ncbi:MAG: ABC-type transport auxiliary lipoprotein family protein [Rhodovibrionaceae bacterium]|nr:ABC-type transport auxiliary lipoprotein family protein [Rhodovibrionaceae bacterium]